MRQGTAAMLCVLRSSLEGERMSWVAVHMKRIAARSPRLAGLVIMGVGLLLVALNVVWIIWKERFYPTALFLAGAAFAFGLWVIITGRVDIRDGRPPQPLWWTVGSCVVGLAGGGAGIWISELLKRQ